MLNLKTLLFEEAFVRLKKGGVENVDIYENEI